MYQHTSDLRIASIRPLLSPAILLEELPLTQQVSTLVSTTRTQVADVLHGRDDRMVVVVGPCSIHDPAAAMDYGLRLQEMRTRYEDDLLIIMRVYFEKPRTTVGWKGLINDPNLDGSFQINQGLRKARRLLRDLAELGVPSGCEFLDPISPQFITDLVTWGAIGARTTESQVHRELASGLSMPIGFKNGTGGSIKLAVDAVLSSSHPHRFMGVTSQGLAAIVATEGNPDCHIILRGGSRGPNFDAETITSTAAALGNNTIQRAVMVDCSHGNSRKDHSQQPSVSQAVAEQVAHGERTIMGVMLESFLVEGRQNAKAGQRDQLTYGQSITDACMNFDTTVNVLENLAKASRARRTV
jgi:3-deoxy-7-phosphoheptulonate synthase